MKHQRDILVQLIIKFSIKQQKRKINKKQNIKAFILSKTFMLQQSTNTNVRIKKTSFLQSTKLAKTPVVLGQTRYTDQFSKYFISKNKDRINPLDSTKFSDRFLINTTKLQKIDYQNSDKKSDNNRSLGYCVSAGEFNYSTTMPKPNSTSQSNRSSILTVNLKRLPRINHSSTGFSVSHKKMQHLKEEVETLFHQTIELLTATRNFSISLNNKKNELNDHCNGEQKRLKVKIIGQFERFFDNTNQEYRSRSTQLKADCDRINEKNRNMKSYLSMIQNRIMNLEDSLGINTGHDKHIA